jgi:hypothetical protein
MQVIKHGGKTLKERIYNLIKQIWEEEQMPNIWKSGLSYSIYKKGDKLACQLLNVSYNILTVILVKRINVHAEDILG